MDRLVFNGEESWFPARYTNVKPAYPDARNSRIFTAYDTIEQREVVIKKISNRFGDVINAKHVCREFFLLDSVSHPNIIKLLDAYTPQRFPHDFSDIYLVTEKMDMSLVELIKIKLKHENISFLVYQMLCGVHHLHQSNIIHRNLDPTNIVIDNKCQLKILDFGLAKNFNENDSYQTPYVVPRHYRAPEIVLGLEYDKEVDIWSIGCIFAALITGNIMFKGSNPISQWDEIVKKLGSPGQDFVKNFPSATRYQIGKNLHQPVPWNELFPDKVFPNNGKDKEINEMARDLLSNMLVIDPKKRISIEEALKHPYFNQWHKPENLEENVVQNVNAFVENDNYTANDWRDMLFNKLQEYRQNQTNLANNTALEIMVMHQNLNEQIMQMDNNLVDFNGSQNLVDFNMMDTTESDFNEDRILDGLIEYVFEHPIPETTSEFNTSSSSGFFSSQQSTPSTNRFSQFSFTSNSTDSQISNSPDG